MAESKKNDGIAFLRSPDFDRIMETALISDGFAIDDDDEVIEAWLSCDAVGEPLSIPAPGYAVVESNGMRPLVLLLHQGEAVGYYVDMSAWIDPDHRGKGLGVEMILAAASCFGRSAFIDRDVRDPRNGVGFSAAGYVIHEKARRRALALAS